MQPVRCVRAYASGASAPDRDSPTGVGRVLRAAGLAHFFCLNGWVGKARAGMYRVCEVELARMNGKS